MNEEAKPLYDADVMAKQLGDMTKSMYQRDEKVIERPMNLVLADIARIAFTEAGDTAVALERIRGILRVDPERHSNPVIPSTSDVLREDVEDIGAAGASVDLVSARNFLRKTGKSFVLLLINPEMGLEWSSSEPLEETQNMLEAVIAQLESR